ncbi:MAG: type II secretion system protein, partial [Christensenellaceae bacterium]
MAKKAKKAFTIVELVIVIAVVAILMAVLIPTFVSLVKKANVSSDTQLVRNLNTA